MVALASTVEGEINSGPSSTALLISANSVPWRIFSKSSVAHERNGHVNITTPILRVICYPFGKTWYIISPYTKFDSSSDSNQILHSDKDHQILVMDRPKICTTNPKKINCYISATVSLISSDFACWRMNPKRCSKNQILNNPRWRTSAILKTAKCDIPATVWPILINFCTTMYIVNKDDY